MLTMLCQRFCVFLPRNVTFFEANEQRPKRVHHEGSQPKPGIPSLAISLSVLVLKEGSEDYGREVYLVRF